MRYHNENKTYYERTNRLLYAIVFYLSLLASIGITIIAPIFITILYGEEYLSAVAPLRIVVWYVAFSYLGVARDSWVVCEEKQKYLKYLYLGSALVNVVLNFILIPIIGVCGASLASLLTQISTIFVFPVIIKDMRPNVKLILDAIMLKDVFKKDRKES